jgi:hypothetical protein
MNHQDTLDLLQQARHALIAATMALSVNQARADRYASTLGTLGEAYHALTETITDIERIGR